MTTARAKELLESARANPCDTTTSIDIALITLVLDQQREIEELKAALIGHAGHSSLPYVPPAIPKLNLSLRTRSYLEGR